MNNPNYEQVIKEAAKMLDKHDPGWHREINGAKLDIEDCFSCIFGQRYGVYSTGMKKYNLVPSEGIGLAFSACNMEGKVQWGDDTVMVLKTQLWLAEINSRLEADARQADKSADAFIARTNEIINLPAKVWEEPTRA